MYWKFLLRVGLVLLIIFAASAIVYSGVNSNWNIVNERAPVMLSVSNSTTTVSSLSSFHNSKTTVFYGWGGNFYLFSNMTFRKSAEWNASVSYHLVVKREQGNANDMSGAILNMSISTNRNTWSIPASLPPGYYDIIVYALINLTGGGSQNATLEFLNVAPNVNGSVIFSVAPPPAELPMYLAYSSGIVFPAFLILSFLSFARMSKLETEERK